MYKCKIVFISILLMIVFISCGEERREDNEQKHKDEVRLFPIAQNGKWGYTDEKGKVVIRPQFEYARNFSEGLAFVKMGDEFGYINGIGQLVVKLRDTFDSKIPLYVLRDFSEGLALYMGKSGGKFGYIDRTGTFAIKPEFGFALPFSEGLAGVYIDPGKFGYIDKTGNFVIEPRFFDGYQFQEGLALVHAPEDTSSSMGFIDKKGKLVIDLRTQYVNDGVKKMVGRYDDAYGFKEGLAPVRNILGSWGFINKNGKEIIEPWFYEAHNFFEGLAVVGVGKRKYGYIDKTGNLFINPIFFSARDFSEGLAPVFLGKWGYINHAKEVVIDFQFDDASTFMHGLALVKVGNKWGYIDKTGRYVWKSTN